MTKILGREAVLRPNFWADAAVLGVAVVWGASYPVAKGALIWAPVLALIFWRFLITALVMGFLARRDLAAASRGDLARAALLGTILFAIFLAETQGLARTSAGNAALIISLCVLFTAFLDYGLAGRLPPSGVLAGSLAACAGVGLLAGGLGGWSSGDALILGAAVLRAIMVVATKRLMAGRSLSTAALTAVQGACVCLLSLGPLLLLEGPARILPEGAGAEFWARVAFLSLFCTIAAFYVQNAALRRTSPTRVGLLMGTEPLFGFALAWLLLSEPITARSLAGAALIVGGAFLGLTAERADREA